MLRHAPASSRTALCRVLLAAWGLVLVGCASEPALLAVGTPREQALAQLGAPTGRYALAEGGERLQYSREPGGQAVVNIDVGADGRVSSVQQVLDEANFGAIQVDVWREADVLRYLGRPAEISRVHSFDGVVWTWRYRQVTVDRLLHLFIDRTGTVRRVQLTDDWSRLPQRDR